MKLPRALQQYLINHNALRGFFALEFGPDLRLGNSHGDPDSFGLSPDQVKPGQPVQHLHPALETETFADAFELPFLNLANGVVCDLHHFRDKERHFLLFLDRSDQFDVVSRHQQHSHNVQLSNDRFRRLVKELTATQARLHKANEEKALLIAMLSHEFGTPLSAISGYAQLLEKGKIPPEKAAPVIRRNAVSLISMIRNALHYGQLHSQNSPSTTTGFSIRNLLEDIQSTFLPLAKNKGLDFLVETRQTPETMYCDRDRLRQILINLLSNAFKYTPSGHVQLMVDGTEKTNVTFRVRDTGSGIPADKIPQLFTPWVRGTQTQASGSGLGLVISKQLAESIGGNLSMKKTSKKGTEFELRVPRKSAPAEVTSGQRTLLQHKHVLLVDDDPDILYLCQLLLEEQGLHVTTASSVKDACELFSNRRFDVILTDINLADGHGEIVLDRVREHSQALPVLAMSALPHPQTVQRLLQRGFSAVIPKPIDEASLLQELQNALP